MIDDENKWDVEISREIFVEFKIGVVYYKVPMWWRNISIYIFLLLASGLEFFVVVVIRKTKKKRLEDE